MALSQIFSRILNMSLTASVVIVFVLIARLLLKKAPKVFSYALWSVVLLRLILPVSISAPFSLFELFDTPLSQPGKTTSSVEYIRPEVTEDRVWGTPIPQTGGTAGTVTGSTGENSAAQSSVTADSYPAYVKVLSVVWIVGIVLLLIYSAVSYVIFKRKLVGAVPLRDNIFIADHIPTPFVTGLIRPKIYIPSALSSGEADYVILHEQYHIKRLDHVVKLVSFFVLCIHWFNPLVWAAFILSVRDMEMSCDEAVIKTMGSDIRSDYSASLLNLTAGHRVISPTPLAFGEGDTKGRIVNLSNWKKPKVWITVLCSVLCVILAVCLFVNPANPKGEIMIEGVIYYQARSYGDDDMPRGTYEIGRFLGNQEDKNGHPAADFCGADTDILMGMPIYRASATEIWTITDGGFIPFRAETAVSGDFNTPDVPKGTGSGSWEFNPYLSSQFPAFRYEFDMEYTEISVFCNSGGLIDADSEPETVDLSSYSKTLTLSAGHALYWLPMTDSILMPSAAKINFEVKNGEEIITSGYINIVSAEREGQLPMIYTSTIYGEDLHIAQNGKAHGAIISFEPTDNTGGIVMLESGIWPENRYTAGFPAPGFGTVTSGWTHDDIGYCLISLDGVSSTEFFSYLAMLENSEFRKIASVSDNVDGPGYLSHNVLLSDSNTNLSITYGKENLTIAVMLENK